MTSLATGETFAALRGVTYDPDDLVASFNLEAASGLVESHCRRLFLASEEEEIYLDGSGGDSLVLPNPPVWDVVYVAVDDEEIDSTLYTWDIAAGLLQYKEPTTSEWFRGRNNVFVIYSHGYYLDEDEGEPVLPAEVSMVACQLAQRGMTITSNSGGAVTSEQIGSYSVSYSEASTSSSVGLTDLERSALGPHRLTRIGR